LAQEAQAKHGSLQPWRGVKLVLLAWIAMLGFDFFLHGGLLAGLYLRPGPFLLPPLEAARRIPLGYVGFLIAAAFLVWIISKINARGWREGLGAGAVIGGSMGASLALGMYSITTAGPILLVAWAVGQTIEMAYAGAVAGQGLEAKSLGRLFLVVTLATIGLVIIAIVMQSVGMVPTARIG
jgi:hypothetical protein